MNVPPVEFTGHPQHAGNPVRAAQRAPAARRSETGPPDPTKVDRPTTAAGEEPRNATPGVQDAAKGPGVLRLIEEGHFKGVADVRLRINFFDELSSRANTASIPVVEEQSRALVAVVQGQADKLINTLAVDEEARDAIAEAVEGFDIAIEAFVGEAVAGGDINRDDLAAGIESIFDELVDRLGELLAPPTIETEPTPYAELPDVAAGGEPGPVAQVARDYVEVLPDLIDEVQDEPEIEPSDTLPDQMDTPQVDYEEAIASLRAAFEDALSALLSSVDAATQLPDPSAPAGNGVAYEKFLAIYDELRGAALRVDETG